MNRARRLIYGVDLDLCVAAALIDDEGTRLRQEHATRDVHDA